MKNITLIAMENSANHGLGVNFCGYQLQEIVIVLITVIFSHLFRKKSCIDMGFIWQQ